MIAMVLMLITFFLVIGFGIGALATMNLNLAGRSVTTVKANQLAEAAAAEFINHVQVKAEAINRNVQMNKLAPPSLELDKDYDGKKNIFNPPPKYIGDRCSVDIHFVKLNAQDMFYSTDNIEGPVPVNGARESVPPFSIDLIVNVTVGSSVRHYQVTISRKWDYVVYCDKAPVHFLNSFDFTKNPPRVLKPSSINGSVFSGFKPDEENTYNQYIFIGSNPVPSPAPPGQPAPSPVYYGGDELVVSNCIPARTIPASIFIGGIISARILMVNEDTGESGYNYNEILSCESNSMNGKGVFSYPSPTPPPGPEFCVFPKNDGSQIKKSVFSSSVQNPVECLKPIDDSEVTCQRVNEKSYSSAIKIVYNDYIGKYRTNHGLSGTVTINYDKNGNPTDQNYAQEKEFRDRLEEAWKFKKNDFASSVRTVMFVEKSFETKPDPNTGDYNWGAKSRYVVQAEDGMYYPLVDTVINAKCSAWISEKTLNPDGSYSLLEGFSNEFTEKKIQPPDNRITLNNSLLVARGNLELRNTNFTGDNTMLQVDGNVDICSGKITAGKSVGTVIFCNSFYCASSGTFKGVIIARNSVKIGNPYDANSPDMKGCIVIGGDTPAPDPLNNSIDVGGMVCNGMTLTYDPSYLRVLNRFGKFRIISWKEIY